VEEEEKDESILTNLDSFDILTINVKLRDGKVKKFDVKKELAIDEGNLSQDFIEQPGKFAWWGVLAEVAKSYIDTTKAELERAQAGADRRAREQLDMDGLKVTESAVDKAIKLDEEYQAALKKHNLAKKNAGVLDKISKAFDHRKEMLINLGAHLRREEKGEQEIRS
jgi:flavin-binding protein dodecin